MTVAKDLAHYVHSLRYGDIDPIVIHEAKRRVLDTLGCAVGAYNAEPVSVARKITKAVKGPSTVIGTRHGTTPGLATFANTTASRYLDFMDTYFYNGEYIHPEDMICGLLSVAQARKVSGKDFLLSIVIGYEIASRFVDIFNIRKRGWDHVIWITMGEALAVSRMMKLSEEQTAEALAIAIAQSTPLRQIRIGKLSSWKAMAVAKSSYDGMFAAGLASQGITGPTDVYEGINGFFKQVTGSSRFSMKDFCRKGAGFRIMDVHIKKYPAEINSQSAIDAALDVRKKVGNKKIRKINIETFTAGYEIIADKTKWHPTNRETADHSLPYIVCAALLDGRLDEHSFTMKRIKDPRINALLKATSVRPTKECDKDYYPGTPTIVKVVTDEGVFSSKVIHPRGFSKNPMSDKELESKFTGLTAQHLTSSQISSAMKLVWNLDKETDVSKIFRTLVVKK